MNRYASDRITRRTMIGASLAAGVSLSPAARAQDVIPMNIGYQSAWGTIGNVFEAMRNTNIMQLNGIDAKWKMFTHGGTTGEGFLAGEIDNMIAAEGPVVRATARREGSRLLARINDYRFGVVVGSDFQGKSLSDIRGKKIGAAFAAGSFGLIMGKLASLGFKNPMQEIQFVNLDAAEMVNAFQSKAIDGVLIWDPALEKLVQSTNAKPLWISSVGDFQGQGWLGLSGPFLNKYGANGATRFMKSFVLANWWASNNIDTVRGWFAETSRMPVALLAASDAADRNMRKPLPSVEAVDLTITDKDLASVQGVIDMLVQLKLLQARVDVKALLDGSHLQRAQAELRTDKAIEQRIKVTRT